MKRGSAHAWSGQWEQATEEYRLALEQFPEDVSAQTSLAMALHKCGQLEEALELYQRLWQAQPSNLVMLQRLAELQEATGDRESAATNYRLLAEVQSRRRATREAFRAWQKVVELDPGKPLFWNSLVDAAVQVGAVGEVVPGYLMLARELALQGRFQEAVGVAERVQKVDPTNPLVPAVLAGIRRGLEYSWRMSSLGEEARAEELAKVIPPIQVAPTRRLGREAAAPPAEAAPPARGLVPEAPAPTPVERPAAPAPPAAQAEAPVAARPALPEQPPAAPMEAIPEPAPPEEERPIAAAPEVEAPAEAVPEEVAPEVPSAEAPEVEVAPEEKPIEAEAPEEAAPEEVVPEIALDREEAGPELPPEEPEAAREEPTLLVPVPTEGEPAEEPAVEGRIPLHEEEALVEIQPQRLVGEEPVSEERPEEILPEEIAALPYPFEPEALAEGVAPEEAPAEEVPPAAEAPEGAAPAEELPAAAEEAQPEAVPEVAIPAEEERPAAVAPEVEAPAAEVAAPAPKPELPDEALGPNIAVVRRFPELAGPFRQVVLDGQAVTDETGVLEELRRRFGEESFTVQPTRDKVPTVWVPRDRVREVLGFLKTQLQQPYRTLFDLTAIDERTRANRHGQPPSDFSVVYHLLSYERNADVRVKVPLRGEFPSIRTVTDLWPSANWYEREVWDMFGIQIEGHPCLRRILMPPAWKGHPLRKDYPARGTELGPFMLSHEKEQAEQEALKFRPEEWGLTRHGRDEEFMFLNLGPQHPGTHGPFRVVLQLQGEEIVDAIPDIGFHHRAAEKMGERQSWHTYIPYTDRVDYLGGVMNEMAYLVPLEQLAGIRVPDRAKVIRIMMSELFRIGNHLVFLGTFAQDVGQLSPVFYMFTDREQIFKIVEAVCGARMHPVWFRIGGVSQDLPRGWEELVREFLNYFPPRLNQYEKMVMQNRIFKARTQGVGKFTVDQAIEWGATGPMLRATGFEWDFRKKRPYSGYDQFEFDVPTGQHGDCYDRAAVHMEEMRQSVRIIQQCLDNMPPGPYKSDHPLATPPAKERTMHDIETLITHFLNVSWGPVVPAGECSGSIEATKGCNSYYLISDRNTISYRTRIRTPSFPHLQMIPLMTRGFMVSDLLATLGSIDFVLSDVDR